MELLQLKYFCLVAKYENMTKAAKELHIVQPAISQSIRRLEKEMGVQLFDRKGKKLSLNKAGSYLYETLPDIITKLDSLKNEVNKIAEKDKQKIAILIEASSSIIPNLISSYKVDHQDVKFSLLNQDFNQWDLCITSQTSSEATQEGDIVLLEEEILLATDDEKYREETQIDLMKLKDQELIGLREGRIFRTMTDNYLDQLGIQPNYSHESDNPAMVREIIDALGGYAFYPEKTWGQIHNPKIKTLHICNGSLRRKIILKVNKKKSSQVLQEFVEYMVQYYFEMKKLL